MTEELQDQSTPELSMDDFMGAQFDALEVEEAPEPNPVEETEPVIGASVDDVDVEAKTDTDADKAPDTDEKAADEPAEGQTITAPQSMSAKDRESFYALPSDSQKWVLDREKAQTADYTRKTMELADKGKTYDKLDQILAPRRQQLAMDGMDESTAVGQLFALSDFANKDPVGFTKYLLSQRQIPLSALTESGGNVPADPQLQAVMNELHGLKSSISQQQTAAQYQVSQSITSAIEEFAADPAYSFYSELEQDMIPLVASFRQSNPGLSNKEYLAKAYKSALAVNDEVSAKVNADNKAKTEAARIAKVKKEAAAAKKASGVNVRGSGNLPAAAAKAKDVDSFIGALVDERMTA